MKRPGALLAGLAIARLAVISGLIVEVFSRFLHEIQTNVLGFQLGAVFANSLIAAPWVLIIIAMALVAEPEVPCLWRRLGLVVGMLLIPLTVFPYRANMFLLSSSTTVSWWLGTLWQLLPAIVLGCFLVCAGSLSLKLAAADLQWRFQLLAWVLPLMILLEIATSEIDLLLGWVMKFPLALASIIFVGLVYRSLKALSELVSRQVRPV